MGYFAFYAGPPYATPDSHLYDIEHGYYNLRGLGHKAILVGFSAPVACAAGVVAALALAAAPMPKVVNIASVPSHPSVLTAEGKVGPAQRVEIPDTAIAESTPPSPPLQARGEEAIGPDEQRNALKVGKDAEAEAAPKPTPQITIKPGNSLWSLSRELYGAGRHYATLLNANKDKIADPKLIYPGQVLAAPKQMEN